MEVSHVPFALIDELIADRQADVHRYRRDGDKTRWKMAKLEIGRLEGLKEQAQETPERCGYDDAEDITGYSRRQLRRKLEDGTLTNWGKTNAPRFSVAELEQNRKPGHTPVWDTDREFGTDSSDLVVDDFDAGAMAEDMAA